MKSFSVAIICGGPSLERGISLNSARSAMDHLLSLGLHVEVVYINPRLDFFHIENGQLYSNTPADFDFKLKDKLDNPAEFLSRVDLIFPIIHGKYGEDGGIQKFLEENCIPFVGSSSESCKQMFSKSNFNRLLWENGFDTTELVRIVQSKVVVKPDVSGSSIGVSATADCSDASFEFENDSFELSKEIQSKIERIFKIKSKVVVKPDVSGSSIGVSATADCSDIYERIHEIFANNIDNIAVVEEFCEGAEFTVIVLQNNLGLPVALVPTEIEILSKDKIFDYRKKYLSTNSTRWHTPPRFKDTIIKRIMSEAERIFRLFDVEDFIRIDGWLLDDGRLIFTDINPISGLEQNSFVFQQAAWCGLSHSELLRYILRNACMRYNLELSLSNHKHPTRDVFILFGGDSAERQVSLMSGTNVWLKLLNSSIYRPKPFLLDGDFVWSLPYQYTINHTVEEIKYNCEYARQLMDNLGLYIKNIRINLGLSNMYEVEIPRRWKLSEFLDYIQLERVFFFLGLHGGFGEDGTIQSMLDIRRIEYNGSNTPVSRLCMNKYETGKVVIPDVDSLPKILSKIVNNNLVEVVNKIPVIEKILTYNSLKVVLNSDRLIIKPCSDGCSAGIIMISSQEDLDRYIAYVYNDELYDDGVQMPNDAQFKDYIIEPFIEVDTIFARDNLLVIDKKTGWIEMTVGIVEDNSVYHSFNPSITIAESNILSLAEKFQGGTGMNLTPPPEEIVSKEQLELIKKSIEKIGLVFCLKNYARIDIFFNTTTNRMILIEINTLPALTPSTVIFHQALAEKKPIYPLEFLERIISKKLIS